MYLLNATTILDTAHGQPTIGVGGGVRSLRAAVTVWGVGVDLDGLELLGNPRSWRNIEGIKIPVSHQKLWRRSWHQSTGKENHRWVGGQMGNSAPAAVWCRSWFVQTGADLVTWQWKTIFCPCWESEDVEDNLLLHGTSSSMSILMVGQWWSGEDRPGGLTLTLLSRTTRTSSSDPLLHRMLVHWSLSGLMTPVCQKILDDEDSDVPVPQTISTCTTEEFLIFFWAVMKQCYYYFYIILMNM